MTGPLVRRQPVLVMETGVNQVPGGTQAGWVSGNPAGLGDGASVNVAFDLGPDWDQYPVIGLSVQPVGAISLSAVSASGSDTATFNFARRLGGAFTPGASPATMYATITTATGSAVIALRPMGRYVIVSMVNTAAGGAMGASKVVLAAYPA